LKRIRRDKGADVFKIGKKHGAQKRKNERREENFRISEEARNGRELHQ